MNESELHSAFCRELRPIKKLFLHKGKGVQKLAENKIGAIFQGKMEYGPRALGARSILANPKNKKIKDILNKEFKQREDFQPFAPSVLKGKEQDYFDFPKTHRG